jgi:hypothetical protein
MSQSPKSETPQVPARRRRIRPAADSILDQAGGIFQRAGFADTGFLLHWPSIAGAHIARVAQPVKWQETPAGAVVTLRCEPAAAVLLQHETRGLVDRCNIWLGAGRITRFKFAPGPLHPPSTPPSHPAPEQENQARPTDLSDALRRLARTRAALAS